MMINSASCIGPLGILFKANSTELTPYNSEHEPTPMSASFSGVSSVVCSLTRSAAGPKSPYSPRGPCSGNKFSENEKLNFPLHRSPSLSNGRRRRFRSRTDPLRLDFEYVDELPSLLTFEHVHGCRSDVRDHSGNSYPPPGVLQNFSHESMNERGISLDLNGSPSFVASPGLQNNSNSLTCGLDELSDSDPVQEGNDDLYVSSPGLIQAARSSRITEVQRAHYTSPISIRSRSDLSNEKSTPLSLSRDKLIPTTIASTFSSDPGISRSFCRLAGKKR